jgi:hypothetical protein
VKRKHSISDWDRAHTEDFVREMLKRQGATSVPLTLINRLVDKVLATLPDKENAR